jgi:alpha-galactosidase
MKVVNRITNGSFRLKTVIPVLLASFLCINVADCQTITNLPSNGIDVHKWVKQHFAEGKIPPFSFVYGGKSSGTFIKNWKYSAEKLKSSDPNVEDLVYSYTDSHSGLVVKCFVTCFNDFKSVEWVLKFSNLSGNDTPLIERAAVIDNTFVSEEGGTFILHHARGNNAERTDFQPIDEKMEIGKSTYMTPIGGRSSDNTAFPFFNIEIPGQQGIMVAVGWTGKWFADVRQSDEKTVSLKSGMEKMQLKLYPKEEIRTPKICLLFWKGEDRMVGHNQFRRFILAHHSRMINDRFAEYPLSGSFDFGDPPPCNEYICLTEEYAIALVKRYQQFRITPENFWLDAGWFEGCGWDKVKGDWSQNVGNWTADHERFPHGLKPVSDAVHSVGSKFMVWFEPERVRPGTMIDREHPEWLIKIEGNDDALFNMGNKEARLWMTDNISSSIKSEGIDNYRQDFNLDPMTYWVKNDRPDRIGISEIRHIEGLYAFWDSLLVRFPALLIDNCAKGGGRLDLESTSRSAPLWRSGCQHGDVNGYQCHSYALNFYLPIHGTGIFKADNYSFRSGLGSTASSAWKITVANSESILSMQKLISDYKSLRPYFYGDFYPLTETKNFTGNNVWLAYQLNRPEQNDGIILVFRREESTDTFIRVKLRGIDVKENYELIDEDSQTKMTVSGEELLKGYKLTLDEKPSSLLIRYRKSQ